MAKIFAWKDKGPDQDGTDGDDYMAGGNGPNHFRGLGGNDELVGGNGDDTLEGGDGNDKIVGGDGSDVMIGGAGADTFVYTDHWQSQYIASPRDGQFDRDTITDFNPVEDKLDFSQVSNGAVTSYSQVSYEEDSSGTLVHIDIPGLESNDMGIMLLGVVASDLTEANFIFA